MILVAGPSPSVDATPDEERTRVDGVEDLPETVPPDSVLFVSRRALGDPRILVEEACGRTEGPLVTLAVVDSVAEADVDRRLYDGVVAADADAETVRSAVERARRLVSYREALDEYYVECSRGRDGTSRVRADERFAALPALDADDFTALLWGDRDG